MMDIVDQELQGRASEIRRGLELLFKTNMKVSDWDIPEPDDQEIAQKLLKIFQDELAQIAQDVKDGKYKNY
jgi:hypothetical protein